MLVLGKTPFQDIYIFCLIMISCMHVCCDFACMECGTCRNEVSIISTYFRLGVSIQQKMNFGMPDNYANLQVHKFMFLEF